MDVLAAFSVTTATTSLVLSKPRGEFPVTVKNEGTVDDRVDLEVEPVGDPAGPGRLADRSWFSVDGKPLPVLRPIAAGASETFTVVVDLAGSVAGSGTGAGLPANGTYAFRPLVYSAVRSHSETLVRGPDLALVLALPVPKTRPSWWRRYWWVLLAALLLVLVLVAVIVLLTRHSARFPAGGRTLTKQVSAPIGGTFDQAHKRLVVAEFGGRIAAVDLDKGRVTALGNGFSQPEDVLLGSDGRLLVSERTGSLLRLPAAGGDRADSTVLAGGMTAPQQMALTKDGRHLFLVEFTPGGRLLRFDLDGGSVTGPTVVLSGLDQPIGVAVDARGTHAFVTEQGTQSLVDLDTATKTRRVLVSGLTSAFFVAWADDKRTALLVTERDPANAVVRVELAHPAAKPLLTGVPVRPSSTVAIGGRDVVVLSDREVRGYTLK